MASAGRQGDRTNFAASYSRSVSGGGGLLGAFSSNTAGASARLQLARTWSVESTGNYSVRKNVSPQSISTEQGGHSVSGTVSFQHPLGEHISATFAYQRLHQSYSSIAAISSDPDNDRESVSISYQFTRPLGR
jgi:hypothetical protein